MATVAILDGCVAQVRSVLTRIGEATVAPAAEAFRANASYWSENVAAQMNRRDARAVVYLLRDAGDLRSLPVVLRADARLWADYLEART